MEMGNNETLYFQENSRMSLLTFALLLCACVCTCVLFPNCTQTEHDSIYSCWSCTIISIVTIDRTYRCRLLVGPLEMETSSPSGLSLVCSDEVSLLSCTSKSLAIIGLQMGGLVSKPTLLETKSLEIWRFHAHKFLQQPIKDSSTLFTKVRFWSSPVNLQTLGNLEWRHQFCSFPKPNYTFFIWNGDCSYHSPLNNKQ